ncbi:hypothetical protein [Clostridium algidicarnis]|uniref:hypothetical protein n=1 Tax=Clostridium algidicarnis TaxID=37659 RepID=UPI0031453E23
MFVKKYGIEEFLDCLERNEKKGTNKIHTAPIPYSRAAVTLVRKVMQKLCGLKGFGDLSYN